MVRLSDERLKSIIQFFLKHISLRDDLKKQLAPFFLKLGDDAEGSGFISQLTSRLKDMAFQPGVSQDDLIKFSLFFNHRDLNSALAHRVSPKIRHEYFPQYLEAAAAGGGATISATGGAPHSITPPSVVGSTTTTANTAPYPKPLGVLKRMNWINRRKRKSRASRSS